MGALLRTELAEVYSDHAGNISRNSSFGLLGGGTTTSILEDETVSPTHHHDGGIAQGFLPCLHDAYLQRLHLFRRRSFDIPRKLHVDHDIGVRSDLISRS